MHPTDWSRIQQPPRAGAAASSSGYPRALRRGGCGHRAHCRGGGGIYGTVGAVVGCAVACAGLACCETVASSMAENGNAAAAAEETNKYGV